MDEMVVNVNVVLEQTANKTITVRATQETTAEDVCIQICRIIGIGTLARHLFALRVTGEKYFLASNHKFKDKLTTVDFRIRFKPANLPNLAKTDAKAYDYYFHQARTDVLENNIPDLEFEKYRQELIGLGITDMYRVMLEKDIPRDTVENEYKKYIPKEVLKRHHFFVKKPIHYMLRKLQQANYDVSYVKSQYISQLEIIAPEYLSEQYVALTCDTESCYNINVKISPYHPTQPGLVYTTDSKKDKLVIICTIEDLGFISIGRDLKVEIARKNGIPFYLKFASSNQMSSFITALDGYYRLTCKWTYNICKEISTPSLQKLFQMKCHGPVGGEFSYAKLEEKRNNKTGCFIIRESESNYNEYFIDVCCKDSLKPKTYKLEKISKGEYIFNDDVTRYQSINQLIAAYNDPNGDIFLQECLPASEYDISPLLLCRSDNIIIESLTDSSALTTQLPAAPLCINPKDLQVYKGKKKSGLRGITMVYRSMWKITKDKKIEVAMKILKDESSERFLKDFLTIAGQWAFLNSSSIVKMFGITLSGNISYVLEYFRLGPLDQYLRENKHTKLLKQVDLIEAGSNLAYALWHLKENDIIHGNIRCRKLMVWTHDENSFTVKLADPGIHSSYTAADVHWIPVECYGNFDYARRSATADVWAFATTMWEIFTFAEDLTALDHLQYKMGYMAGQRLPKPSLCPEELYSLLKECWDGDPHRRKRPQAILRDINQMLYQLFNSRKVHTYATLGPRASRQSLISSRTESTTVGHSADLVPASDVDSICSGSSYNDNVNLLWPSEMQELGDHSGWASSDFSNFVNLSLPTATTSLDSLSSMQSAFELDEECRVVLQGRIGQGFYGEVFKGMLEYLNAEQEPRKVAVKKLKSSAQTSTIQDFEREINIMKELKHPNIVEILGVFREDDISLIMEFVEHRSLQSYLKIHKDLDNQHRLKYALDITKGMEYLGTKNIVHRDLAARNILVVDKNHVKISDFGLAQVLGANEYYILKTNREMPIKWYAPESLRDGKFSKASDVWSFGVTMCELFNYGEEPQLAVRDVHCEGLEQEILLNALEQGVRFPCPQSCPRMYYSRLIYPCWNANPKDRPEFRQLRVETEDILTNAHL